MKLIFPSSGQRFRDIHSIRTTGRKKKTVRRIRAGVTTAAPSLLREVERVLRRPRGRGGTDGRLILPGRAVTMVLCAKVVLL
ncbi:hypothetical protein NicSoilC5_37810 [Arthrobacter sp. NicSoilC5]|nr:hypothetical protein NicSoilC5_37810 [Arthrobacter sp. NicSoilC5]